MHLLAFLALLPLVRSWEIPAEPAQPAPSIPLADLLSPKHPPAADPPPMHHYVPPHLQDFIALQYQSPWLAEYGYGVNGTASGDGLERRQQGGVGGGLPPPVAAPTQMPTVTPFAGAPGGIYTQLFSAVPEQWPGPKSGSVGLGTVTGPVGVVRTGERSAGSGSRRASSALVFGAVLGVVGFVG